MSCNPRTASKQTALRKLLPRNTTVLLLVVVVLVIVTVSRQASRRSGSTRLEDLGTGTYESLADSSRAALTHHVGRSLDRRTGAPKSTATPRMEFFLPAPRTGSTFSERLTRQRYPFCASCSDSSPSVPRNLNISQNVWCHRPAGTCARTLNPGCWCCYHCQWATRDFGILTTVSVGRHQGQLGRHRLA